MHTIETQQAPELHEGQTTTQLQAADLNSVAIQRLIREISDEENVIPLHGYNRTYNRHNR